MRLRPKVPTIRYTTNRDALGRAKTGPDDRWGYSLALIQFHSRHPLPLEQVAGAQWNYSWKPCKLLADRHKSLLYTNFHSSLEPGCSTVVLELGVNVIDRDPNTVLLRLTLFLFFKIIIFLLFFPLYFLLHFFPIYFDFLLLVFLCIFCTNLFFFLGTSWENSETSCFKQCRMKRTPVSD